MSRSAEEWESARNNAVRIRSHLYRAIEELEEWDTRFVDIGETCRQYAEDRINNAIANINTLIGSLTIGGI